MQESFIFDDEPLITRIAHGAYWLRGFCVNKADAYWAILTEHFVYYPPQTMMTPMGHPMSVKTTSFGDVGWVGNARGYHYSRADQENGRNWPSIPKPLIDLAVQSASAAGYHNFMPDTCLVNVYAVGAKMGLHQDKDEHDFSQPIVSVSLGLPATFLFGGNNRHSPTQKIQLTHGDVVVWGGKSRQYYHGVKPIENGLHPLIGRLRCNLTFRKAM